jgi:hypothetical protein
VALQTLTHLHYRDIDLVLFGMLVPNGKTVGIVQGKGPSVEVNVILVRLTTRPDAARDLEPDSIGNRQLIVQDFFWTRRVTAG